MNTNRRILVLLFALVLALSLAACGGSQSSEPAEGSGISEENAPQETQTEKPSLWSVFSTPEPEKVPVSGISLSDTALEIYIGTEEADGILAAGVLPENADIQGVAFSSSDPGVVTVDENGAFHAVSLGTATITVAAEDPEYTGSAVCQITVLSRVSSIVLNSEMELLYPNDTVALTAEVEPADVKGVTFAWASSDETVATVGEDGTITAVGTGIADVTYTALDGSGIQGACQVLVGAQAKALKLEEKAVTLLVGAGEDLSVHQLFAVTTPEEASVFGMTWTSSNESVAVVDENGRVTAIAPGKATITCVSRDPKSNGRIKAVCAVTVGDAVRGITLTGTGDRIAKGLTMKLTAAFDPVKPFNPKLTWTSSDESVLTVDARGTVKAVGVGTAEITCTAVDGSGVSATISLTVYQPVTKLVGSEKRLILFEGTTGQLSVTVSPEDATDKSVTWVSADESIASVDENGKVTAGKPGTTTITATANDGSKRAVKFSIIIEPDVVLDATTFTRSGYFGYYNEFAITFKNLTRSRTITYISFKLTFNDGRGNTVTRNYYTDSDTLTPGSTRQIGWWKESLTYAYNFRVYLQSVRFSDGTTRYYGTDTLLGWFN